MNCANTHSCFSIIPVTNPSRKSNPCSSTSSTSTGGHVVSPFKIESFPRMRTLMKKNGHSLKSVHGGDANFYTESDVKYIGKEGLASFLDSESEDSASTLSITVVGASGDLVKKKIFHASMRPTRHTRPSPRLRPLRLPVPPVATNFTPSALSTYTSLQQIIILDHLKSWVFSSACLPIPLHIPARELNLETSQTVFVGPYLSKENRPRFTTSYNLFNVGLMKLPFDLLGFAFRKALLAVERLVDTLTDCATKSKARMEKGEEPLCLIDLWM